LLKASYKELKERVRILSVIPTSSNTGRIPVAGS